MTTEELKEAIDVQREISVLNDLYSKINTLNIPRSKDTILDFITNRIEELNYEFKNL